MKKISSLLLLFVFIGFLQVKPASAALSPGYVSGCLEAPGWTPSHLATLNIKQGDKVVPQPNKDTWVFVCITSGENTYCTAGGNGSADETLFESKEHYNKLLTIKGEGGYIGGVVEGGGYSNQNPPKKTNNDGTNPQFAGEVTWGDAYYPGVVHQWSWVQAVDAVPAGTGAGEVGALQQGTTPFDKLVKATKDCAKISWDPRGVVFDVNTFFPVKGKGVELYKRDTADDLYKLVPNGLFLTNPASTNHPGKENGQYSFFVETGWYKLKLVNAESIAVLTAAQAETAANLSIDNIYTTDKAIYEQAGSVKIANIPINVADTSLLVKELTIIDNVAPSLEGNGIRLYGRVSHPKTKMIITKNMMDAAGVIKPFVSTDYTDGLGEYNKLISQTVDSVEPLVFQNATLSFELNSFYTTGVFSQKKNDSNIIARFLNGMWSAVLKKLDVDAAVTATNTISIKPIPAYIEGIAYDTKGIAIPGAIVGIYPFYSEKPFYLTVADANGRYKIGSQYIPRFEYGLRYKKPTGEVILIDTSTFVKQNAKLILTEGIKPFEEKNTTVAEDKKVQDYFANITTPIELKAPDKAQKSGSNNKYTAGGSSGSTSRDQAENPTQTQGGVGVLGQGMQGVIMIVVVIMILLMIGVGAFIMMKSKQQTPQY